MNNYKLIFGVSAISAMFEKYVGVEPVMLLGLCLVISLEALLDIWAKIKAEKEVDLLKIFFDKIIEIFIFTTSLTVFNIFRPMGAGLELLGFGLNFYDWIYYVIFHICVIYYIIKVLKRLGQLGYGWAKIASEKIEKKSSEGG